MRIGSNVNMRFYIQRSSRGPWRSKAHLYSILIVTERSSIGWNHRDVTCVTTVLDDQGQRDKITKLLAVDMLDPKNLAIPHDTSNHFIIVCTQTQTQQLSLTISLP